MSLYEEVVAYTRDISPETDPKELLRFCADVGEEDELLSTVPIMFFQARGGPVTTLARTARELRETIDVGALLARFRECLLLDGWGPGTQRENSTEFQCLFYKMALEVADEVGDTDVRAALECSVQNNHLVREFFENSE